jgi:hypothetical protein
MNKFGVPFLTPLASDDSENAPNLRQRSLTNIRLNSNFGWSMELTNIPTASNAKCRGQRKKRKIEKGDDAEKYFHTDSQNLNYINFSVSHCNVLLPRFTFCGFIVL